MNLRVLHLVSFTNNALTLSFSHCGGLLSLFLIGIYFDFLLLHPPFLLVMEERYRRGIKLLIVEGEEED